jgi:hypothetical protein
MDGEEAAVVDVAEQIRWWDILELLSRSWTRSLGVAIARTCRHPDAQWLASLFPAEESATSRRLPEVMLEQRDDPRAMYFCLEVRREGKRQGPPEAGGADGVRGGPVPAGRGVSRRRERIVRVG